MNPHGIEPNFLKIEFVVAGAGFYSYYNLQRIKLDKERKNERKKALCIQKHLTQFLKMGSIPCWVQFHVYQYQDLLKNTSLYRTLQTQMNH